MRRGSNRSPTSSPIPGTFLSGRIFATPQACARSCRSINLGQVVASERTYRVLDVLINTQPAVNYLKKVTFHEVTAEAH
jgi:hypothetical protein